ncbi:endonuclease [Gayadomonas joobiniege]|uniref:endonuclease n=1 Tax=Gayadomonas joobiniege TaxID=1234606 RepID=UPI000377F3F0|nr:endonuclease [Gayadomonas joobiniege]
MKLKKLLFSCLIAAGFGSVAQAEVIFTEYVEGSGHNKAIEISNLGSSQVDLGAQKYQVRLHSNGTTENTNSLDLTGFVLPAGASLVIYNSSADAEFQGTSDFSISSSVTFFNGDDALTLVKDGTIVDRIGQFGVDPGSAWQSINDADFSTRDKTIRRLDSISSGDENAQAVFPNSPLQWKTFAQNTFDGLGCPGEGACSSDSGNTDNGGESGEGNGSGDSSQPAVCLNCPEVDKILDNSQLVMSDYYADALSADKAGLKQTLNQIISRSHKKLTYAQVWTVLTESDQDPVNSNNIIEVYTGWSVPKANNASGAQSSDQDAWNREHIWPRSRGLTTDEAYAFTDLHHLKPADVSVNAARAHFDFALGGVPLDEASTNSINLDAQTFAPRDEVKGDIARILFYMDTRYQGDSSDLTPDLQLIDDLSQLSDTKVGRLCTLLAWHNQDVVDSFEQNRNKVIYEYQGNRNPFIDYPEFANLVYAHECDSETDNQLPDIVFNHEIRVNAGEYVNLDARPKQHPVGTQIKYHWQQIGGSQVSFKPELSALYFKAPMDAQTLTFLLVLDYGHTKLDKTVAITVVENDKAENEQNTDQSDTEQYSIRSGSSSFAFILFFIILMFNRRLK